MLALETEFGLSDLAQDSAARLPAPDKEKEEEVDDAAFVSLPRDIIARLVAPEREFLALASELEHLDKTLKRSSQKLADGRLVYPPMHLDDMALHLRDRKYFDGCIAYLTRTHEGNLHERAVFTVTTGSPGKVDPGTAPKNILELGSDRSFRSDDSRFQWVSWTFHFRHIVVIQYTIRSDGLRSWMLEGSEDARHWYVIDWRRNDQSFQKGVATATFGVERGVRSTYVRLVQTARNHSGSHVLSLEAVEFFGILTQHQYIQDQD